MTGGAAAIAVTLGGCDDMRAEVFVRVVRQAAAGAADGRLVGTVSGPRRRRDTTLPTTARLVPVPGGAAVSRAILTEPAYWTPELPNLYRIDARVECADHQGTPLEATIGLRRLGIRGRSFWLDGRRWVPRATVITGSADLMPAVGGSVAIATPADDILRAADERGVAVVALVADGSLTMEQIGRLASHPAAMLAIVAAWPSDVAVIEDVRRAAGTLQIGLAVDGESPPPVIPEAVAFVAVCLRPGGVPHPAWRALPSRPLVAWRADPTEDRAACAVLQRDLAQWGLAAGVDRLPWDWAGYLVGPRLWTNG